MGNFFGSIKNFQIWHKRQNFSSNIGLNQSKTISKSHALTKSLSKLSVYLRWFLIHISLLMEKKYFCKSKMLSVSTQSVINCQIWHKWQNFSSKIGLNPSKKISKNDVLTISLSKLSVYLRWFFIYPWWWKTIFLEIKNAQCVNPEVSWCL